MTPDLRWLDRADPAVSTRGPQLAAARQAHRPARTPRGLAGRRETSRTIAIAGRPEWRPESGNAGPVSLPIGFEVT